MLPANVLIDDPSSDWLRLAVPFVFQTDLATARHFLPGFANTESAAYQLNADEVLRVTVEKRGAQIKMEAIVTGLRSQINTQVVTVEANSFITAADQLAKRLDAESTAFSTANDDALRSFSASLAAPDVKTRLAAVNAALAIDPRFGLAQVARLELTSASGAGDLPGYIADATKYRSGFRPVDRARFDALVSRLTHAPLNDQEKTAAALLQFLPNEAESNAVLGSLQFLAGDSAGGARSLTRAIELNPANASYRRDLAIGFVESKKFPDAEKILAPLAKTNPNLLPDLAVTILLGGDAVRANRTFEQFLALRPANDPLATLLRGTWLALGGQLNGAIALLQSANVPDPNLRAAVLSQVAIWQLRTGSTADAKKTLAQATAANRQSPAVLLASLLTAAGADPAAWRKLVESSPLSANAGARQAVLGYGFFLGGHFEDAAEVWKKASNDAGGTDLRSRTMLAASLDRAGHAAEARAVPVQPFLPEFTDLYSAISFGEMRRLLGLQMH